MRFTAFCLLLTVVLGCNGRTTTLDQIQASGVLRVGLDPTYPPFEVADANDVWGLDVDLARAIAAKMGVTAEFVYFGYDGLYDALLTEQADVLLSALVVDESRTGDFAYSDPYFNAGQILLVAADETEIAGLDDLNGRVLAVELGSQGHVEALAAQRRVPNLTVQPHNSPEAALAALTDPTAAADAVLIDAISGRLFLADNPGLRRLPQPVTVEPFAIVTRRADGDLLDALNDALQTLQASGELDAIVASWLGE